MIHEECQNQVHIGKTYPSVGSNLKKSGDPNFECCKEGNLEENDRSLTWFSLVTSNPKVSRAPSVISSTTHDDAKVLFFEDDIFDAKNDMEKLIGVLFGREEALLLASKNYFDVLVEAK